MEERWSEDGREGGSEDEEEHRGGRSSQTDGGQLGAAGTFRCFQIQPSPAFTHVHSSASARLYAISEKKKETLPPPADGKEQD